MRVEPYTVGSYVHVTKRGARGMPITRDERDQWRFVRLLYHMNDEYKNDSWERMTAELSLFERPPQWPGRKPLVSVLAWTLMPNHFHLLLKETREGGLTKFLQKLCGSMSTHFNLKYHERGSIFQGAYRGKTVQEDNYLRWLASYIMVKNTFELYEGGLSAACEKFDDAWSWAQRYPFSSLSDYVDKSNSPILTKDIYAKLLADPQKFKNASRDMLLSLTWERQNDLKTLAAE